jgi:hypothetical protein
MLGETSSSNGISSSPTDTWRPMLDMQASTRF